MPEAGAIAMGKLEYLDALKRAMLGLPPELQARTLAWYEQRFVDGAAAGRLETDIARELDDPKKVALTLRANSHMAAFAEQKNPANLLRLCVSVVGLLIFNLFMVIPAAVFGSLLAALYVTALAFYVGGIAITASGLSGASELVLDGPLRHVSFGDGGAGERVRTRISISETGIEIDDAGDAAAERDAEAEAADAAEGRSIESSRVVRGAERVAGSSVRISTDLDEDARMTQTVLGFALVLGGIVLFLVSIVVTRYAASGVRRYLQMNMSLLRGS
ncbi:DUF1700 domain-containing protein [Massilia sp. IC2-278]|uniref:DUF1700 domain-containing protein n=1 Tax=Massilia sp. IC2-278 TaxID=2887200 RepID=UPI001E3F2CA1|nr:DUF1700 domain-containing protein [Massilia sp. IC2-278]MCC2959410.1 DUF1700 domain-containing protein [Massilia sp. IC2-278]